MGRRNQGLIHDLSNAPWWVGVALGTVGYVAFTYVLPAIEFDNPFLAPLAGAVSLFAPFWLLICFLGAGVSALNAWRTRSLHASQRRSPNLNALSWHEFERLVGEHFRQRGYAVIEKGGSQADGGIDLIVSKAGERYVVQCKHWKARQVGVSVVRELVGSITQDGAAGGFLVASGTLTAPALQLAREAGVEVIDGPTLVAELRGIANDAAVKDGGLPASGSTSTSCPVCRGPMRLRTARKGKHAGSQFWGCSAFPQCRGTRPLSTGA